LFRFICVAVILSSEPRVYRAQPSSFDFMIIVFLFLYYPFAAQDPDQEGRLGDKDLEEANWSFEVGVRAVLILIIGSRGR